MDGQNWVFVTGICFVRNKRRFEGQFLEPSKVASSAIIMHAYGTSLTSVDAISQKQVSRNCKWVVPPNVNLDVDAAASRESTATWMELWFDTTNM